MVVPFAYSTKFIHFNITYFYFLKFYIGAELINNVVLASGIQQLTITY